jgi:hypothetical protein
LQALTEGFTEGHIAADIIIISGWPLRWSVGHLRLPTNLVQMASPGPSRSHARRVGAILKPRGRRAAEQRDEVASPHSITSSARMEVEVEAIFVLRRPGTK